MQALFENEDLAQVHELLDEGSEFYKRDELLNEAKRITIQIIQGVENNMANRHYVFTIGDDLGRPMTHRNDQWASSMEEAYGKMVLSFVESGQAQAHVVSVHIQDTDAVKIPVMIPEHRLAFGGVVKDTGAIDWSRWEAVATNEEWDYAVETPAPVTPKAAPAKAEVFPLVKTASNRFFTQAKQTDSKAVYYVSNLKGEAWFESKKAFQMASVMTQLDKYTYPTSAEAEAVVLFLEATQPK